MIDPRDCGWKKWQSIISGFEKKSRGVKMSWVDLFKERYFGSVLIACIGGSEKLQMI